MARLISYQVGLYHCRWDNYESWYCWLRHWGQNVILHGQTRLRLTLLPPYMSCQKWDNITVRRVFSHPKDAVLTHRPEGHCKHGWLYLWPISCHIQPNTSGWPDPVFWGQWAFGTFNLVCYQTTAQLARVQLIPNVAQHCPRWADFPFSACQHPRVSSTRVVRHHWGCYKSWKRTFRLMFWRVLLLSAFTADCTVIQYPSGQTGH